MGIFSEVVQGPCMRSDCHFSLKTRRYFLFASRSFECLKDMLAKCAQFIASRDCSSFKPSLEFLFYWEQCHVNAFGFALRFRQILPDFLGGENEDGSSETD